MSKDKFARQPKIKKQLRGSVKWLIEHGGRTLQDLIVDDGGEFVLMTNGFTDVKVYLPKDLC